MSDLVTSAAGRAALRRHLRDTYEWLCQSDMGPQAVTAGECDVCGQEPRMVQPCGPPPAALGYGAGPDWALGRRCAEQAGTAGWCDGHHQEALKALAWLRGLTPNADVIARLWWLATGEIRPDPKLRSTATSLLANLGPLGADPAHKSQGSR